MGVGLPWSDPFNYQNHLSCRPPAIALHKAFKLRTYNKSWRTWDMKAPLFSLMGLSNQSSPYPHSGATYLRPVPEILSRVIQSTPEKLEHGCMLVALLYLASARRTGMFQLCGFYSHDIPWSIQARVSEGCPAQPATPPQPGPGSLRTWAQGAALGSNLFCLP